MNPVTPSPKNTYFPIYKEVASKDIQIYEVGYTKTETKEDLSKITFLYGEINQISLDTYNLIKNEFNAPEKDQNFYNKLRVFYCAFADLSSDEKIFPDALNNARSCLSEHKNISFINNCVMTAGKYYLKDRMELHNKYFNKCDFLIKSGEPVNLVYDCPGRALTPVHIALMNKLDNKLIELLLKAGSCTFEKISEEEQENVNQIMQPIIEKINVISMLISNNTSMSIVENDGSITATIPKELKTQIGLMVIEDLNLAPIVLKKICDIIFGKRDSLLEKVKIPRFEIKSDASA